MAAGFCAAKVREADEKQGRVCDSGWLVLPTRTGAGLMEIFVGYFPTRTIVKAERPADAADLPDTEQQ